MDIQNKEKTIRLFDLYSDLLTDYQKEIFENYYIDDLSLMEISEIKKVSRNAVFSLIHRVEKILYDYEEKLHLFDKYNAILDALDDSVKQEIKDKIQEIMEG